MRLSDLADQLEAERYGSPTPPPDRDEQIRDHLVRLVDLVREALEDGHA